jgi:dolichyl-phosphate beta-glucosyltransferase
VETTYSIVIPAYNEEGRIGATLERTLAFFADRPEQLVEILVVDDGSVDGTVSLIEAWQEESPLIRLLRHEKNMGKGWAVRTGMLAAEGECVLFMDADGSTDIGELDGLTAALNDGTDIAIGSRDLAASEIRQHQPFVREMMGKAFSMIARYLAIPGIADTTCGFKLFRKPVVAPLFERQTVRGWAYDVEILYLAMRMNYRVAEVPVHWTDSPDSRVNLVGVVLPTLRDLIWIRLVHRSVGRKKDM